ncbi:MAG: branched-chain amino acid ABC transporter permease, partial [Pseudomonadota bacterium]
MLTPFTRFLLPGDMRVFAILAVILLSMPFWLPLIGGYTDLAIRIAIFAIFALGFDILLGFTGYLSFGHAAFFGVSAYATALTFQHFSLNIIPAMLVGVSCSVILAIVLGLITLRRSGIYFSILTLAFAEMMYRLAYSVLTGVTGGENGLRVSGVPHLFGMEMHGLPAFYVCVILLLVLYALVKRMSTSQVGLMLRAIKSNQTRLEYAGANLFYYKILAFVLSAAFAGLAGSLLVAT